MNHSDKVKARKAIKRGSQGQATVGASPSQMLYNAQDLHRRETMGASAGQAMVPDWNTPSSLFSPKLRRR